MMKKFKKIAAMAASMLVLASGMTTLDSNAIYCAVSAFKDNDKYQEMIAEFNSYSQYTNHPELCEAISELYYTRSDSVANVWLAPWTDDSGCLFADFIVDYMHDDSIYIEVDVSDMQDITPETLVQEINENINLSEEIHGFKARYLEEYNEELEQFVQIDVIGITLTFVNRNHDANYQDCKKIISFMKENYNIKKANAEIDIHEIQKGNCGAATNSFGLLTEEEVNAINENLKNNGLSAHVDKKDFHSVEQEYGDSDEYHIVIDNRENLTMVEKFKICSFVKQNYGISSYSYVLSSGAMPQTIDLLNLSGDTDCDDKVNINDAILVMQSIANPDKYKISEQGKANADIDGNGITLSDAIAIQEMAASHLYD